MVGDLREYLYDDVRFIILEYVRGAEFKDVMEELLKRTYMAFANVPWRTSNSAIGDSFSCKIHGEANENSLLLGYCAALKCTCPFQEGYVSENGRIYPDHPNYAVQPGHFPCIWRHPDEGRVFRA